MPRALIFGSGLISSPVISYLHETFGSDLDLVIANFNEKELKRIIGNKPYRGVVIDVTKEEDLREIEKELRICAIVVSLLPAPMHVSVAKLCIKHKGEVVHLEIKGGIS